MSSDSEPNQRPHSQRPDSVRAMSGDRLWTPWRMRYVAGDDREEGCIFCSRLAAADDVESLILHRGERSFVIMNLYPYNTGHLMIVPNLHVASPENVDSETMSEMAALRGPVLRALRRALSPEGFNLGLNVGATAGAGVADHLHEHVVPRWQGDANFMPIIATTMVMPELLPVTYAKLRAELARELGIGEPRTTLVLMAGRDQVLADAAGALPKSTARDSEPIWRAALRDAHRRGAIDPEILGWAGDRQAGSGRPALLMRANFPENGVLVSGNRLATLSELLAGPNADLARAALRQTGDDRVG